MALWKLLVTITLRESAKRGQEANARERDVGREQTIAGQNDGESGQWVLEQMDSSGPSPAEAALLNERWNAAWNAR